MSDGGNNDNVLEVRNLSVSYRSLRGTVRTLRHVDLALIDEPEGVPIRPLFDGGSQRGVAAIKIERALSQRGKDFVSGSSPEPVLDTIVRL